MKTKNKKTQQKAKGNCKRGSNLTVKRNRQSFC